MSILDASGSVPEVTVSGSYRGVGVEQHLRPKARLECVVGADHPSTVMDTVLKHTSQRCFAFVVAVEDAYPIETVKARRGGCSGKVDQLLSVSARSAAPPRSRSYN
jgi:hypothetical protein